MTIEIKLTRSELGMLGNCIGIERDGVLVTLDKEGGY